MSITKEQILDAVAEMSIVDITKLVSMMEERFGVSSSSFVNNLENSQKESTEEKTEFNVVLKEIGANKIAVIKAVRSAIGLGLKEAKDLVESFPVVLKENIGKDDADSLRKVLEEAGASVKIE